MATTRPTRTTRPKRTTLETLARQVSEDDLQQNVLDLLRLHGFLVNHNYDSRRSGPDKGLPDILAVHPRDGRIIVAELKREGETPTEAQQAWLQAFRHAYGCEVYILRPLDWLTGHIERVITRQAAA